MAFLKVGTIPLASEFVLAQLQQRFPEYEVDVIDLSTLVRSRPDLLAVNAGATLGAYGWDILRGKRKVRQSFLRTHYLYGRIKRLAREWIRPGEHAFSFQMQSLFDTSVPGVPHLIYTDHTNQSNLEYASGVERSLYPPRWQALEAAIYHNAARVFVRSHNVLQTLVTHYGLAPERVHCVYAGSNAKLELRPASGDRHDRKRILFVGLDWERKGGPTLLEAFRRIRHRHPDATLTLVGASPALDEPNVDRVGPVSIDRVHEYYEQASVFCMPTWQEPFGIVFVEAMSHGLPILSTRVGALPDMVEDGHNGYLIDPGDAATLAGHLDELLSDPQRRRDLGENGRTLAQDRYNWDRVGQRMEGHIRQLLTDGPSGPDRSAQL